MKWVKRGGPAFDEMRGVANEMVGHDENGMGDGDSRPLWARAGRHTAELSTPVSVAGMASGLGGWNERGAPVQMARWHTGRAVASGTLVLARCQAGPDSLALTRRMNCAIL
jgi:hypothetical protein